MKGLLFLLLMTSPAISKDFGVQGTIFEIQEQDLYAHLMRKLQGMGEAAQKKHHRIIQKRIQYKLKNPASLGLNKTFKNRSWTYDPSITLTQDIKLHDGRVLHRAGTTLNPLKHRALPQPLLFIDGGDHDQVTWALGQDHAKIILTAGSPFSLMERYGLPFFFDQGGVLTRKLGIHHVPARVRGEGLLLRIEEVLLP